ncbi:hypothetical protein, partial [Rhodoplanes roseus]|uniref:hypothetical protein n=1 Tax=Rhodoplanes roseus TaxID=29409 RepID=UPI00147279E2
AVVGFRLEPTAAGSRVAVATDLTLAGSIIRYVRGTAIYRDIAAYLFREFAEALEQTVAAEEGVASRE